ADRIADRIVDRPAEAAAAPQATVSPVARKAMRVMLYLNAHGGGAARAAPATDGGAGAEGASGASKPGADPIVARLSLHADTETVDRTKITWAELQAAQVGHAWVSLTYLDPSKVPATIGAPTQGLLKGARSAFGLWPLIFRARQWTRANGAPGALTV